MPDSSADNSTISMYVWYCHTCTVMIHPPGRNGFAVNGEHYCFACARAAGLVTGKPTPEELSATSPHTVPHEELVPVEVPAALPPTTVAVTTAKTQKRQAQNQGWLLAGVAMLVLGGVGITFMLTRPGSNPETEIVEQKAPRISVVSLGNSAPAPAPAQKTPEDSRAVTPGLGMLTHIDVRNPDSKTRPVAALSPEALAQNLKQAAQLSQQEKYTEAFDLLKQVKTKFSMLPFWNDGAEFKKVQTAAEQQYDDYKAQADDVLQKVQKSDSAQFLSSVEAAWQPRTKLSEMSAQPARVIVKAVGDARARASKARIAAAAEFFEQNEKLLKNRESGRKTVDQINKALDEFEPKLIENPDLAEKFGERWATLRFDTLVARDGDLAAFRTTVNVSGIVADITYDFSNAEQFKAWTVDTPQDAEAIWDPKAKIVSLRCRAEHFWDGKDRRNTPMVRLPFLFQSDNWVYEAEMSLAQAKSHDKHELNCDYGIVIWDGGTSNIRFTLRESKPGELHPFILGQMGEERIDVKSQKLQARPQDRVKLTISCSNGRLTFTARSAAQLLSCGRCRINFDPKYVGFVVRTHDKEENANVAFYSAKINAIPNKYKVSESLNSARKASIAATKAYLQQKIKEAQKK